MAMVSIIQCEQCHEERSVMHPPSELKPKICGFCIGKNQEQRRHNNLEALEKFSIEERLARIEAWIEDYRPPKSIHDVRF